MQLFKTNSNYRNWSSSKLCSDVTKVSNSISLNLKRIFKDEKIEITEILSFRKKIVDVF